MDNFLNRYCAPGSALESKLLRRPPQNTFSTVSAHSGILHRGRKTVANGAKRKFGERRYSTEFISAQPKSPQSASGHCHCRRGLRAEIRATFAARNRALQSIYRDASVPTGARIRAVISSLPIKRPKLAVTAHLNGEGFADRLERVMVHSRKVIEAQASEIIRE